MEIKLCTSCNGEGEVEYTEYRDPELIECSKCKGTGRVITNTYTYTVPYTSNRSTIYQKDAEIHALLRELEKALK